MSVAHVLVVEDDFLIAEDIRGRLMQLNHEVVGITGSGEEAIELARALRPDLVLMDGSLNGALDGFETAQIIERLLGCPIVYVTANARASGMPYSVRKPFSTSALEAAIAQALGTQKPS